MSSSKAVVALLNDATVKRRQGDLKTSTALLERALRIEPKNPNVWYQLADVRFRQQNYKLAESLAMKSNALSLGDPALQIRNWRLISIARLKRGDAEGSRQAKQKALSIKSSTE
jgi:Tfp pilus assembly protein PilF